MMVIMRNLQHNIGNDLGFYSTATKGFGLRALWFGIFGRWVRLKG